MNIAKLFGMLLIVADLLGLIYGAFSYTRQTSNAKIGPIEFKMQERKTVNIPLIASGGAIAVGIFLMLAGRNK